jgi:predicted 2-oxoglutarate/Fe(II)-dependent dioxygenase YbiX
VNRSPSPDGPVQADCGDLIGFTARTEHEITRVTRGYRMSLVRFGRYER